MDKRAKAKFPRLQGHGINKTATGHVQVPVKVNAWADAEIASLVEALNGFDSLWTTSSCQGNGERAYVHFAFRGSSNRFAGFVESLSAELRRRIPAVSQYRLALEWVAGGEKPLGALTVHREIVPALSEAIRNIASDFPAKSPAPRGIRGTGLHNSRGRRDRQRSAPRHGGIQRLPG